LAESSEAKYKTAFATSSASLTESAERNASPKSLLQLFLYVCRWHDQGPDRRASGARRYLINPDFVGRKVRGQIWSHGADTALGHRIGGESRHPEHRLNRTIQYDRRAFIQMRRSGLNSEENTR
jgi:hypothetical protein